MSRPGHPVWCLPSMCTATATGGQHQAEPAQIRDNLLAVLRQRPGQPPRIAVEHWDNPDAAEPAELILLDLDDAARLSTVLARIAATAGGAR